MLLVVGLGNPGREHEGQRHNIGFVVTSELRARWGLPDFKSKWSALTTRGEAGGSGSGRSVAILQPQTYMNRSGDAAAPAAAFYGVAPADVLVVHDELDLPFGEVRIKVGGGHAGHNGLRSIIQRLGTPDFVRVRVGIGRPPPRPTGAEGDAASSVSTWVLSRFDAAERAALSEVVGRAAEAATRVLVDGPAAAQLAVHTKR